MNRRIFGIVIVGVVVVLAMPRIAGSGATVREPRRRSSSPTPPSPRQRRFRKVRSRHLRRGTGAKAGAPLPVPAFCRVQLTVAPQIHMEAVDARVRLEQQVPGCGRRWVCRSDRLSRTGRRASAGYATASTDTGHQGNAAEFALGHPELVVDFGYRAIHEMTVKGKQVTESVLRFRPRAKAISSAVQPVDARDLRRRNGILTTTTVSSRERRPSTRTRSWSVALRSGSRPSKIRRATSRHRSFPPSTPRP